jgi:hypothetical protein
VAPRHRICCSVRFTPSQPQSLLCLPTIVAVRLLNSCLGPRTPAGFAVVTERAAPRQWLRSVSVVSSCMALGHPRCRRSRPSIQSGPPDVRELSACCCSSNRTRPTAHSNTNIKREGAEPADAHSARAPARHGRVARAMRAVQAASPASSPVQQQAQAAWRALRTAGAEQVTQTGACI